jgi:hypothetical protein
MKSPRPGAPSFWLADVGVEAHAAVLPSPVCCRNRVSAPWDFRISLRVVKAARTDEAKAVNGKDKEVPINDFMTRNGRIREDGRVIRDMFLMQAKSPDESKGD